ncbi:FIG00897849: hypothetical protein [hydrothermal vent metagenome]|uniref:Gliding motility protein SprA N-terminal domain-containing protein n=1 Tax=hydrothermal vent metagenome TaxID=652676 RepID=A0A3B0T9L4_9ZZZZ
MRLRRIEKKILFLNFIIIFLLAWAYPSVALDYMSGYPAPPPQDTTEIEEPGQLPFPFKDEPAFSIPKERKDSSYLFLHKPSNIKYDIEYDPVTGEYIFYQKIGNLNYRLPKTMSLKDYIDYDFNKSIQDYWRQRSNLQDMEHQGSLIPKLTVGGEAFNRIFGGNTVNINPQGYVEVIFGYQVNTTENPAIPEKLRKVPTFDFDEKIQMNVTGQIGEKMKMRVNYNTEATFDYENKMNLEYTGDEDEIIKRIEAGNVSLPLNGSLITGASNLFGIKAEMQFGKLTLTTLFSQNKGETQVVETQGGAQVSNFEINVADYDANRHFFLAQYFKNQYNKALQDLPVIRTNITINKIEVWVTNKSSNFDDARNLLAFQDLGEHDPDIYNNISAFQENPGLPYPKNVYPFNDANGLYKEMATTYSTIREAENITSAMAAFGTRFVGGRDFEKVEQARKLSPSEYTVNKQLGYISLNSALNADEVLAVAFNYTANGVTYQVGEFSTDGVDAPQTLIMKLLKGTNLTPSLPTWGLMMKNIYSLNAYQLSKEDFVLNVLYLNDSTGTYINYIPQGRLNGHILLQVMNLDNLNTQMDPYRDGLYDYIEGITVNSQNGRIIFPVLEPFGKHLADSIKDPALIEKYTFQSLYDSTKTFALQDAEHNKFRLKGSYKGASSSDISLGAINVARGSVKVSAGGIVLQENIDYTVDYALGRVRIINPGYQDAQLQISTESEDLFTMQRKTLMGAHANYAFSDNFNLGATVLHMQERPLTQKVDYGQDPISNTMLGLETRYNTQSQFLTKMIDRLPFINTKTPSSINFEAEFAQLIPGHSKIINKDGTVYIDDFEATKTAISLKTRQSWVMASTPQLQRQFKEANLNNSLEYNYNRAKLAWYFIDPLFLRGNSYTPNHIKTDVNQLSNHYVREVFEAEIYPAKETVAGQPTNIGVFDLAYYPNERGPYNFDTKPSPYSAGTNPDGSLRDPESRWGGIMRKIETPDFETANIEFIEFWMLDPFIYDSLHQIGGDLYFNLGDISEDILKDSRKSFENGLPTSAVVNDVDTTIWGRVSTQQSLVNSFANDPKARLYQDVGLDGLNDDDEKSFFDDYLNDLSGVVDQQAYTEALNDPSSDDYHYFRGADYDQEQLSILERYKKFNGVDGNSPESTSDIQPSYSTPDIEDINDDNTLNEYERYYQYKISIHPEDFVIGKNHITDIQRTSPIRLKNGNEESVTWYQFKIPVTNPDEAFGSISDFKSIRFMRMFLKGFKSPVILRFASLDLVRADWRKYSRPLTGETGLSPNSTFDVSAVNIEENGNREPVNYILPPGINRVIDPANPQLRKLNEQSLMLKVIDLGQGDAKAAYKNIYMDFRRYKKLKMEVHAEEIAGHPIKDGDLSLFIRLGSDFNYNYYEYEVPLALTPYGRYNGDIESDRYIVWPEENRINIPLNLFTDAKLARNADLRKAGSGLTIQDVYEMIDKNSYTGKNIVKIKGSPNLGNVAVMMMGIRYNKKDGFDPGPRSIEVWLNELRLSDFDEEGGWAANARLSARLADLGSITVAGRKRSTGFGSIESNMNNRSLEDLTQLDVALSLDMGRFFPEKARLRIPMYYGYSRNTSTPKYNPLDPDIELKKSLRMAETAQERDSIKSISQDLVVRKSIKFTNVKVDPNPNSTKMRIYDLSNFAATYSYNEIFRRNVNTEYNLDKTYRGMLSYNYSSRPTTITPFKKIKFLQKGPFKLIGDFNFSPLPAQISYRTDLYRHYNEILTRNITNPDLIIPRTFDKEFLWNKYFDLRYNLTRSLKFDFSSNSTSRIDEPEGRINKVDDDYGWKKDSIMSNLLDLGRPTIYNHNINISYQLPLNRIKLLNFLSASTRYRATYNWTAGPITADTINLGNFVENTRNWTMTGTVNMSTIYNKVPFFKEVNSKFKRTGRSYGRRRSPAQARAQSQSPKPQGQEKEVAYNGKNIKLFAGKPKRITHKLSTEKVKVTFKNAQGKPIKGKSTVLDKNHIQFIPDSDEANAQVTITGKRESANTLKKILYLTTRMLLGVQNISINYGLNEGTVLPGYLPTPRWFGGGNYTSGTTVFGDAISKNYAPGIPFLLGWQDSNFARRAARNGWITTDSLLNMPFLLNKNERFDLRATIEPLPDLRISLTANRSVSKNTSEYYNYNHSTGNFDANSRTVQGNFTMSTFTWGTAFFAIGKGEVQSSEAFERLKKNRLTIARRLAGRRVSSPEQQYNPNAPHTNYPEYPSGYGPTSVEVLVPAFLAAYQNQDPNKVSLSLFPSIKSIRPNWRISYDGMVSRIPALNKIMKSLNVTHAYRSSYSVGSFLTNLNYLNEGDGLSYIRDIQDNFVPAFDFNSVNINESFSPLINVDVMWANDLTTRAEIRRSRNMTLSFANNQLTEVVSNEYTFGLGYRFTQMDLIIKTKNSQKSYSNDLNITADVSLRKNKTILRKLVEGNDQITAGQSAVTIKTTADYMLSDRFQLRVFYDRIVNKPFISTAFPTSNTSFGLSFRFTLAQ